EGRPPPRGDQLHVRRRVCVVLASHGGPSPRRRALELHRCLSRHVASRRSCPWLPARGTCWRVAQHARAGTGPLRGRHRATGCRFGEAREEVVREECRGARLVGTGRNGGGTRAVANRLRRRQVDANPAEFARDGSIAPRPRSTDITRGVTAPDALPPAISADFPFAV